MIQIDILYPPTVQAFGSPIITGKPIEIDFETSIGNTIEEFAGGFVRIKRFSSGVPITGRGSYPENYIPFKNTFFPLSYPNTQSTLPRVKRRKSGQYYIEIPTELLGPLLVEGERYKIQVMLTKDFVNSTGPYGSGTPQYYSKAEGRFATVTSRYFEGDIVSRGVSEWSRNSVVYSTPVVDYTLAYSRLAPITTFVGRKVSGGSFGNVISFKIDIYDRDDELVESSGEVRANKIEWKNKIPLRDGENYLELSVKTREGHLIKKRETLVYKRTEPSIKPHNFTVEPYDNGMVRVSYSIDFKDGEKGVAIFKRDLEKGLEWEEIFRVLSNRSWYYDPVIRSGSHYSYAVAPVYFDGTIGQLSESKSVVCHVEGLHISSVEGDVSIDLTYDGVIGTVSSTRGVSSVETLGGKHPVQFFSSDLDYKTFNVKAMVTQEQLENINYEWLVSKDGISNEKVRKDLEDSLRCDNSYYDTMQGVWQRVLLQWLGDGEAKLIKSQFNGSYFVMINEVSFTPNTTTYGMIGEVSFRATEIGEFSDKGVNEVDIYKSKDRNTRLGRVGWH